MISSNSGRKLSTSWLREALNVVVSRYLPALPPAGLRERQFNTARVIILISPEPAKRAIQMNDVSLIDPLTLPYLLVHRSFSSLLPLAVPSVGMTPPGPDLFPAYQPQIHLPQATTPISRRGDTDASGCFGYCSFCDKKASTSPDQHAQRQIIIEAGLDQESAKRLSQKRPRLQIETRAMPSS